MFFFWGDQPLNKLILLTQSQTVFCIVYIICTLNTNFFGQDMRVKVKEEELG